MLPKGNGKFKKKSKTKISLVFNEEKRRDFLTGFHKRKLLRKKKAKEKLEQDLKEEKKRLKAEAKESYKKLIKSHTPIPEFEELLAEEYEDDDVNIKVVELSTNDIAKQNNWIGINQPNYDSDQNESEEDESEAEEVPGMELKRKGHVKKQTEAPKEEPKSKTEIKKILKKQATKNVQKSKAFQVKNKIEGRKQRKKAMQKKNMRIKLQNKSAKRRGGKGKQTQ